ncbi:MAG: hypothetical protein AB2L09_03270 [Coriobacteriia bacterium]
MSKQKKLILGIATAWPLFYIFLFLVVSIVMFSASAQTWLFSVIIPLHLLTITESLVLLGIYVHLLMKDKSIPVAARTRWLMGLILGGPIGQAVFFTLKVWPDDGDTTKATASPAIKPQERVTAHPHNECPFCSAPFDPTDYDTDCLVRRCTRCGNPLDADVTTEAN